MTDPTATSTAAAPAGQTLSVVRVVGLQLTGLYTPEADALIQELRPGILGLHQKSVHPCHYLVFDSFEAADRAWVALDYAELDAAGKTLSAFVPAPANIALRFEDSLDEPVPSSHRRYTDFYDEALYQRLAAEASNLTTTRTTEAGRSQFEQVIGVDPGDSRNAQ
ncbi:hypothetical protein JCM3766R1_001210 [Sporobolomyces carnicolor]